MREKKQSQFMSRMVETVIKGMDEKQQIENEKNLKYQEDKNRR